MSPLDSRSCRRSSRQIHESPGNARCVICRCRASPVASAAAVARETSSVGSGGSPTSIVGQAQTRRACRRRSRGATAQNRARGTPTRCSARRERPPRAAARSLRFGRPSATSQELEVCGVASTYDFMTSQPQAILRFCPSCGLLTTRGERPPRVSWRARPARLLLRSTARPSAPMPESDPDTCWYDHTCLYDAQGRLKPTESIGVDFGPPRGCSPTRSHSGWANRLGRPGRDALHLAQHLGRALVPRVVRLGDVLDDGGCLWPSTANGGIVGAAERFRSRPPLDAFIDTSAVARQARAWIHFDAPVANRVPPLDHIPMLRPTSAHLKSRRIRACSPTAARPVPFSRRTRRTPPPPPTCFDLAAPLRSIRSRIAPSAQSSTAPTCGTARSDYYGSPRVCRIESQSWRTVEYDAIHLRLTPPYPSAYNVTARLQSALRGSGGYGGSCHSRPLYVASDQVEQALKLIRELVARGEAPGRRVLSYYDLDPKLAVNLFGSERASDAEYAYMRPLLTDAMLCVGARRFTPTAGTFSGPSLACARARRRGEWHRHRRDRQGGRVPRNSFLTIMARTAPRSSRALCRAQAHE